MTNLFKKVLILNGKFKDCEGMIQYKTSKYYIIEIWKRIDNDTSPINAVLFKIEDLNTKYIIK